MDDNGITFDQILSGIKTGTDLLSKGYDTYKEFKGGSSGGGVVQSGGAGPAPSAGVKTQGMADSGTIILIALAALFLLAS